MGMGSRPTGAGPEQSAPLESLKRASRRYRRSRSAFRFFCRLTHLAAPGAVAIITLAFLSKLLWPPLLQALWLMPFWVAAAAGYLIARDSEWRISAWRADALADVASGSQGTFMALAEARGEDWAGGVRRLDVPLRAGVPLRQIGTWAAALAAVMAVMLLPDMRPPRARAEIAVTPLTRMEDLVATIKEAELVEESYVERAQEVLEQMKRDEAPSLTAADWQALDGLREELKRQLADGERRFLEQQRTLASLRNLMQEMKGLTEEEVHRAAELLASGEARETVQQLAKAAELSAEELDELMKKCASGQRAFSDKELAFLRSLCKGGGLSPDQLQQLGQCLAGMDAAELAGLCQRMGLGELSPEEVARLLKACKAGKAGFNPGDAESLRKLIAAAECMSGEKAGCCSGLCARLGLNPRSGERPGRGGVTRGPGPAALEGSGQTGTNFGEFEDEKFTGNLGEADVPLGFALSPPEESTSPDAAAGDQPGAAVQFGAGNERITWHSRLLPRHNDVMKNYFGQPTVEDSR